MAHHQVAVLGPLSSDVETRAFLGCAVVDDVPQPDRPLVVVWIPDAVAEDPQRLAQLERETAMVTQLDHPNVSRVFGLQRFEEGWARLVEFIDGEPLRRVADRLREDRDAIETEVIGRMVSDLCSGVHYAHEHGVARASGQPLVHGGVRPDTILVSFDGVTRVTGYGASALAPQGAPTTSSTPDRRHYFAPEQILGGKATASVVTDVYGIGAVLYELLVGRAPYRGASDLEQAVLTGDLAVPMLSPRRDALMNVALRCLSRRGSDRFTSVRELDEAVQDVLRATGVASPAYIADELNRLFVPESPHRQARRMLLEFASDPDTATILTVADGSRSAVPGWATIPPFPSQSPRHAEHQETEDMVPVPSAVPESVVPEAAPFETREAVDPSVDAPSMAQPETGTDDETDFVDEHEPQATDDQGPVTEPEGQVLPEASEVGGPTLPTENADVGAGVDTPWEPTGPSVPSPVQQGGSLVDEGKSADDDEAGLADALSRPAGRPKSHATRPLISEITSFDTKTGDGSRYALFAVLVAAAGILAFLVAFPKEPPEGLAEPGSSGTLPPELVEAALERAEPTNAETDEVSEGATGAAVIKSTPAVDVFRGARKLGRTPLTVALPVGTQELRLTDAEERINAYRSIDIREAEMSHLDVRFERFELQLQGPRGADVFINTTKVARLPAPPLKLYEGEYLVEVQHEGRRWSERVQSRDGKDVEVVLKAVPGGLERQ